MITVSAKNYDEAITKALIELQTTSEHMQVEVVQEGSTGFLGFIGGKPWIIKACLKDEKDSEKTKPLKKEKKKTEIKEIVKEKKADEKPVHPKEENENKEITKARSRKILGEEEVSLLIKTAEDFLEELFCTMDINVNMTSKFNYEHNEISVLLTSEEDMGILIGKRGQTLDSLQYILSLVINKNTDFYIRVKLDTENYRQRRKEKLEILAKNIAFKVKKTRKPLSLEPMNPYERRIIHSVLQNDYQVSTISEGEDPNRYITVVLRNHRGKKNGFNGRYGKNNPANQNKSSNKDKFGKDLQREE